MPPPNPKLSDTLIDLIARRLRILGEPCRLRILEVLQSGEKGVTEIIAAVEGNQPNVSKHLQILHREQLVSRRRVGPNVLYSTCDPTVVKRCQLVVHNEPQISSAESESFHRAAYVPAIESAHGTPRDQRSAAPAHADLFSQAPTWITHVSPIPR